jgi:hypothetical protein
VANVLGHVIDMVDRRYTEFAERNPKYIPPIVETEHNIICDPLTKETLAQRFVRIQAHLKQKAEHVGRRFDVAEKNRANAWNEVVKYKAMMGEISKSKPRSRKSNAGSRSVAPVAAPRPAAYQQQQAAYNRQQVFMPVGRPVQMMASAPMPVQRSQPVNNIPVQMIAGAQMGTPGVSAAPQRSAFNQVVVQSPTPPPAAASPTNAAAAAPEGEGRVSQNAKYCYGDR